MGLPNNVFLFARADLRLDHEWILVLLPFPLWWPLIQGNLAGDEEQKVFRHGPCLQDHIIGLKYSQVHVVKDLLLDLL